MSWGERWENFKRDFVNGWRTITSPGRNRIDRADRVETDPSRDGQASSGDTTQASGDTSRSTELREPRGRHAP